jgi:hypothetical protein
VGPATGEGSILSDLTEGNVPVIGDSDALRDREAEFLRDYRHGTDDTPYFVAQDVSRLPTPTAMALTAAICQEMDQYERPRFTALLLEVAQGRYRSVFDRASN